MGLLEQMILTDWTKLSTTAPYAKTSGASNDWTGQRADQVVESGTRAWLYKTMVPIAYSQIAATPTKRQHRRWPDVDHLPRHGGDARYPMAVDPGRHDGFHGGPSGGTKLPASAAFAPLTARTPTAALPARSCGAWATPRQRLGLQIPSADLTDSLFMAARDKEQRRGRRGRALPRAVLLLGLGLLEPLPVLADPEVARRPAVLPAVTT